ncbi:hypothetical protein GCM10028824_25390 [Hymenobacter segetis]|uniref:DUF4302 domain-containing protein n=1 Tax=Hymenobacter segetis TaxID=2025509 RepID=A0ABU9M1I0_9BACT
MNNTALAANATETSYLLSEGDYTQYAAAWKEFAGPSGANLTQAFLGPDSNRLEALSFPPERIKWLVSAVGVSQIKARFLLMPGPQGERFNLVLFATDATGYRLSAYYLPDPYFTASTPNGGLGEPIPLDLAADWQKNWHDADDIKADMFISYAATSHEAVTLEGYNFEIKDFVSALFGSASVPGQNLSLGLGLHEYHAPTATSEADLTKTFGLVLQAPAAELAARGAAATAARAFDMAFPCPPGT